MREKLKRNWFAIGLGLVFIITIGDVTQTVSGFGSFLKAYRGPDLVIVLIFFCSGLMLDTGQIRAGVTDRSGMLLALGLIFVVSPVVAVGIGLLPIPAEIKIGLFLVAAMPTTLSSGVVMTGAAGGNMAHALVITLSANALSVMTIPVVLSWLLWIVGGHAVVSIDKLSMMLKIGAFVLTPLVLGIGIKNYFARGLGRIQRRLNIVNQLCILVIVWMSLSQSRSAIVASGDMVVIVAAAVFFYHAVLMAAALVLVGILDIPAGRRESVVFMGIQKTLPLSVILQVSLFPGRGTVLVVCVLHHVVHLMMDGLLVGRFKRAGDAAQQRGMPLQSGGTEFQGGIGVDRLEK